MTVPFGHNIPRGLVRARKKEDVNLQSQLESVAQLSHTFRPRRRPQGLRLRDKRERYHHSLKALAIREKKIHIVGSPEMKVEGTPVYMDVEGLPDRDFYYLIGIRFKTGDARVVGSKTSAELGNRGSSQRTWQGNAALTAGGQRIVHEFFPRLRPTETVIIYRSIR